MSTSALDLLQAAHNLGALGQGSINAFTIPNIGTQIQAGLGICVDDVSASEVFLYTELIDDSGSIRFVQGNAQAVRDGSNLVKNALTASKSKDGMLCSTRYLNGTVLDAYKPMTRATRLDTHNYNPNGGTPLYDQMVMTLGQVIAKAKEFEDAGVPVRTVTVILTDGADEHSRSQTATSVAAIVGDMLRQENHLVYLVGIDDGTTDFCFIASGYTMKEVQEAKDNGTLKGLSAKGGMGIPPMFVLTPKNSEHEIREAMMVVSQSAVRASQGGVGFSQAAVAGLGGFTA